MSVYAVDKLMAETRRLAAEYHRLTGQALPVSQELSRYDVERLLGFNPPENIESGVDLLGFVHGKPLKVQVKARVIFDRKQRQKLGQLNPDGGWNAVVLVLMNPNYEPEAIYLASRDVLQPSVEKLEPQKTRRGTLSVAKFKALAEKVWPLEERNLQSI